MDYISGANKRCLDAAIAKYKDTDPYDLSDLSHDSAWEEMCIRDRPYPRPPAQNQWLPLDKDLIFDIG